VGVPGGRLRRGGGRVRLELLVRLGAEDEHAAGIAQLHLFGGLSVEDAGDVLRLSRPVAYRNWRYARAWLRDALKET
jgi:hypothetical protein